MNITQHCFDRYTERIMGIEDFQSARQYINSNRDKITEDINKLVSYATLVYVGQINGDKSTKNYYLRDNIVMVTDTGNSTLITLYRIDFGFGADVDKLITAKLIEEISELSKKKDETKDKVVEFIESKETEVGNINTEIEKTKQLLSTLELKRDTIQSEIKVANKDIELVNKEIEVRALKICNSAEYRKDLLKLNGGK